MRRPLPQAGRDASTLQARLSALRPPFRQGFFALHPLFTGFVSFRASAMLERARRFFQQMPVTAVALELRREILAAVANIRYRVDQVAGRAVFQKEGVASCPHHFADDLAIVGPRQDYHPGSQRFRAERALHELDSVQSREIQVHHGDLRQQCPDLLQRRRPVPALGHHLELRILPHHRGESIAPQRIFVCQAGS